jgi:biopolymer transport protein ExbD
MGAKLAGGGGGKKKGYSTNSEPNVIPFIDIMLVLLIIFMVAAPLPTVDIKVDLPPPNPKAPKEKPLDKPTLVVLEDTAGVLTYRLGNMQGSSPVTLDELRKKLFDEARMNNPTKALDLIALYKDGKVYVQADQETAYVNVIDLMNVIDEIGFKSVSIVSEEAQQ